MAWLDSAAVIASDPETRAAVCSGEQVCLAFPRNWPAAFTSTGALKLLVNKSLRGTRCRAVDVAAESATEEGLDTSDSFACSAQLASASGLVVIKGFVVFECIGPGEGTLGFVAFRHWWNASSGGAWLDRSQPLVPASSGDGRVLLVESALEDGEVRAAIQPPETTAVHKDGGTSATTLSFEAHGDADVGESGDGDTVSADAECDPADPEACLQLAATLRAEGIALFDRGHVGGAKGRFETAADARIHAAQAAKEEGNSCFRRADGSGATAHYERALAALGCGPRPGHLKRVPPQPYDYHYDCGVADAEGDPATVEFARILRLRTPVKLITALHSNAAASSLLEQRFDTARAAATSALRIDPNHTKSRSRRGAAFQALGQHSAACEDLALALAASMGTPAAAELASQLIQQWRLRAPCICKYVDETCARHAKAGAQGAVMALVRALHGIGSAADWARNTPMPGCGLTPDGARMLAWRASSSLIEGAVWCRQQNDPAGARSLLRAASWVVGVRGAIEVEPAMIGSLKEEVEEEPGSPFTARRERFILLIAPDPAISVGLFQLLEALARRRPSNCQHLFLSTLQTSWGFRQSPRVRRALVCLIAWLYRCPSSRARFSHFPADAMNPIMQKQQRCAWLVAGEWTVPSVTHPDYERETGLTIGDGPVEDP